MLVAHEQGKQLGAHAKPLEQTTRAAGILCRHEVHLSQDARGAGREVLQVANGRGHHVQAARVPVSCRIHVG